MSLSPIRLKPGFITDFGRFTSHPKQEDPKEKIQEYYSLLNTQVQRLDLQVEKILHRHEIDFLSAFKGHVFGLQRELMDLRRQLESKETDAYRNQKIANLSKSVQFMQEESMKFGEMLKKAKLECEKWKCKAEALEADNAFLEGQVKTLKRREKLILLSIENTELQKLRKSENEEKQIGTRSVTPRKVGGKKSPHPAICDLLDKYGIQDSQLTHEIEDHISKVTTQATESIRHLQLSLDRSARKIRDLTLQNTHNFSTQNDLQQLFLTCVDEVRREARLRPGPQMQENPLQPSDRRKIIELFCLNDAVFQEIYDRLFVPQNTGMQYVAKSTPMLKKAEKGVF